MQKFHDGKGNCFSQFIHDGCTLDNKSKYQVFGLQFTDKTWQCNHVVDILFKKVLSSIWDHVANLAREQVQSVIAFSFRNVCGCSVQDAGAKSVARHLELEEETCNIHDSDKIGKSTIGELLRRKRGNGFINPFEPGKFG